MLSKIPQSRSHYQAQVSMLVYSCHPADGGDMFLQNVNSLSVANTALHPRRMASPGMLLCVALVKTDVSEELSASIIRVTRIGELGMLAVTSKVPSSPILVDVMMEALCSSETPVLTRATWRNIPEDAILPFAYLQHRPHILQEMCTLETIFPLDTKYREI
jgi:hypothetical protein